MKSMILTAAAAILSIVSFAQEPDYYREIGIYAGIAPFTKPHNARYVGSKNKLPYMVAANACYNFTEHIQVGLDVGMTHWEGNGTAAYNAPLGQPGSARDVKYLYADRAWSVMARANYLIPTYDEYHINRANLYFGVAAGALYTVNDGGITYSQPSGRTNPEERYVSQYNYDWGTGYALGVQAGYSYYLGNHFGVNVEVAPRYTHVNITNHSNGDARGNLEIWSCPVTAGIKFRF